ncbi:MAG: hypothetical protein NT104_00040 [Bacteroidetes bacterium]|nr:hypothetical protein [Bacteroidota bacterium]
MKKLILSAILSASLIACTTQETKTETNAELKPHGYEYDSTANINTIKASFEDMAIHDTASYKSKYADTAVFLDNGRKMSLAENINILNTWQLAGIKVKVSNIAAIWESRFTKKDNTQGTSVVTYLTLTLTKGDQSIDVPINQYDAFVDGKIVKEMLYYDPTRINALMK